VLLVRPNGDFGTSRFKGNYIIRDLTRLRNRWYFTAANWHISAWLIYPLLLGWR